MTFTNLQYRLVSRPEDCNDVHMWFDVTDRVRPRPLTTEEVGVILDTTETWSVDYKNGTSNQLVVHVGEYGFYVNPEFPGRTATVAIRNACLSFDILRICSPEGWSPDMVDVRYVSIVHGVPVITEVPRAFFEDELTDERERMGSRVFDGPTLHWLYGSSGGILDHIQNTHKAGGFEEHWACVTKEDRVMASDVYCRAAVAVLRYFRVNPIRRGGWVQAKRQHPVRVELRVNRGPWLEINAHGTTNAHETL